MSTIGYFQKFGLVGAKTALANIPDKTATHLGVVIDDEPTYYSLDFGSYWDNCDWQDSDYRTVTELSDVYNDGWCVDLSELKRLVESVGLVKKQGGLCWARLHVSVSIARSNYIEAERLKQAIVDYESIYGGAA
ncbi:hypothetical protein [Acinetobacter higginsii]|uniref:hypothetical protein n=1 Tax=Acinetobacter higginsii TaxID=70347 RepID=UPI001F4A1072|nr:hypothetical protein [Acinetobacter higginsii]MCH7295456.1 hypothetical protein [Acinetobacter higginsii]